MIGVLVAILLALVVFWIAAHVSTLLGVFLALLVLFLMIGGPAYRRRL